MSRESEAGVIVRSLMAEPLSDEQIETLARGWPWRRGDVAHALRTAEAQGLELALVVGALDFALRRFGASDPSAVVAMLCAARRPTGWLQAWAIEERLRRA